MEIGIPASEAKKRRRANIVQALGRDRRLTTLEAKHLWDELDEYISTDPAHDPAKHLGKMSIGMHECPGCRAQTLHRAMLAYFESVTP